MKICIDAGHGGDDPGAVADTGLPEDRVALDVALRLACKLRAAGHTVILTRDHDVSRSLSQRAHVSNEAGADLFVSIHLNSVADRDTSADPEGVETLHAAGSARGRRLASALQSALMEALPGHRDRGVKASPSPAYPRKLYVLHATRAPAALVELEFLSSDRLDEWLGTEEAADRFAGAVAAGVLAYLK